MKPTEEWGLMIKCATLYDDCRKCIVKEALVLALLSVMLHFAITYLPVETQSTVTCQVLHIGIIIVGMISIGYGILNCAVMLRMVTILKRLHTLSKESQS